MKKRKYIKDTTLQQIIYAHMAGYSSAEIAKALKLPLMDVSSSIERYHNKSEEFANIVARS